jgi:hypothetical protein
MRLLSTFQFHFLVSKLEVSHVLVFIIQIKREMDDGDLRGFVVILLISKLKNLFCSPCV